MAYRRNRLFILTALVITASSAFAQQVNQWQMISTTGSYFAGKGNELKPHKRTVNFYLDSSSGRGHACLMAPGGACKAFAFPHRDPIELGRYRLVGLAGQDANAGARIAVLDTKTGTAFEYVVLVDSTNGLGNIKFGKLN